MKPLYAVILFMAGVVVANNLHVLIGFNVNYEASWSKVSFAAIMAIGSMLAIIGNKP